MLPVGFIGGYYFFATYWAPRILLTLKARHWLTQFQVLPLGFLLPGDTWPETFLMFVQFTGLVLLLSQLQVVSVGSILSEATQVSRSLKVLATATDNKVQLWKTIRKGFFYRPRWSLLITTVGGVLGGFNFYTFSGKTFPILLIRLRECLLEQLSLSVLDPVHRNG